MSVERSALSIERPAPRGAVFLSYASQDAATVQRIADALRAADVEVWFDQNELVGGDAWDAKIRKQIAECALFVPILSAATQARREGYFRIEWRLAAQRTHAMADGTPFLLPVVIDDTRDAEALVPVEFKAVQWTRLRPAGYGGQARPEEEEPALAKFCARVQRLLSGEGRDASPRRPSSDVSEGPGRLGETSRPANPDRRGPVAAWSLSAVAVLAIAGYFFSQRSSPTTPAAIAPISSPVPAPASGVPDKPASADKSVAVLAFANLSDDKASEVFSDGISESLRDVLSEIPGLKVVPRTSAFSFKGRNVPIPEIAKQLGVAYVVDGTVRKSGNQVRIAVQLVKAADGFPAWSGNFPRELKDIFAVQDEIARLVARALQLRLDIGAQSHGITKNPDAYEAYLKGRQIYNSAATTNHRAAIDLLLRATQLDPNFALAHGALAEAYVAQANVEVEPAAEMFPLARAAAERALGLDARNVQALTALGEIAFHFDWNYEKSDEFLKQAIVVDPNYAGAHGRMAGHYYARGRYEESLAESRRAKEIDPLDATTQTTWSLLAMKRYPEAIAAGREHLARHPDAAFARAGLGLALFAEGKKEEALRVIEELATTMPNHPGALAMLGWILGQTEHTEKARALLERMNAMAETRYVSPLWRASITSGVNDRDRAFALLEQAFELRDPHLPDLITGPLFEPIKGDPRYRAILKRLKLDRHFPELAKP